MQFIKYVTLALATVNAQMTLSGMGMGASSLSGSNSLGQYAASYPSPSQYSSQSYGQPMSSSQMGSFPMQQGSTQVNAQVGQFKVPTSQTFSVPAGYNAPQTQYSQYGSAPQPYAATSQSYTAPSSTYQYPTQTAPQTSNYYGSTANYGSTNYGSAMGLPTQYSSQYTAQSGQYPTTSYSAAQTQQYPAQTQQYPSPYQSAQLSGMGMGMTAQTGTQTTTQQVGVRTLYVPLSQVQQVLSQYPGAQMVGTVTANQIPAGAAVL